MADIQKSYDELSKKYTLPSFEELDNNFEISLIESDKFLLRAIIQKIAEKLDFYSALVESILQPDAASMYSMHECKFFDERQKTKLYTLYKNMMQINRESICVSLSRSQEQEATFINSFFSQWASMQAELTSFAETLKNSWEQETTKEEELEYLG